MCPKELYSQFSREEKFYIELIKSPSYIFHVCPDALAVAVGGGLPAGALGQVEGAHLGHLDVDLEQERLVPLTLNGDLYHL